MYCRPEEFRSVTFLVFTVGRADRLQRSQADRYGKQLAARHTGTLLPSQRAAQQNTAYQDKLGWTLSTEVRARRRGYSTQPLKEERGERREEISGR